MSCARVFLMGRTHHPHHRRLWAFEVRDNEGKVVLKDNCTDLTKIHDRATEGAFAIEVISRTGNSLKYSYDDLVEQVFRGLP